MGKTIQELQEMLEAKMQEVDALQSEIAHAKMIEQVHGKMDLMIDFVLADDKLCKQIALLETDDCDELGRKLAKWLGTSVKKTLDGDALAETKKQTVKPVIAAELVVPVPKEAAKTVDNLKDVVDTVEKKPRKLRTKKSADAEVPQPRQRETWTTEAIEQEAKEQDEQAKEMAPVEPTAAADETPVEGSATAGGIITEPSAVPKKSAASMHMFNPARMMAERGAKR